MKIKLVQNEHLEVHKSTGAVMYVDDIRQVTYSELKNMRDGSLLVPGQLYRITDFVTTVDLAEARSAGHAFDVIVMATAPDMLSEDAKAIQHAGDTYFANSKLEAWELKYCLDNDTTRFNWADTTNGKGVIYYMKDEFDNEVPHDFKNIQWKMYKVTDNHPTRTGLNNRYVSLGKKLPVAMNTYSNGVFGTSAQMTIPDETDYIWAYTFSSDSTGGEQTDLSLLKANNVYDNHITHNTSTTELLMPVVIFDSDQRSLRLEQFANGGFVFAAGANWNNRIYNASSNFSIIGGNANKNWVECQGLVAGTQFQCNLITGACRNLALGDTFVRNALLTDVYDITAGNTVAQCIFNPNSGYIIIGSDAYGHTFDMYTQRIVIAKEYTRRFNIGKENSYLLITSNQTTSSSSQLKYITLKERIQWGLSTMKTISHNTVNDDFETTYQNANNRTVNL